RSAEPGVSCYRRHSASAPGLDAGAIGCREAFGVRSIPALWMSPDDSQPKARQCRALQTLRAVRLRIWRHYRDAPAFARRTLSPKEKQCATLALCYGLPVIPNEPNQ